MPPKKTNTFPYIVGSLGLIIVAVIFSAIVNRNQSSQTASEDIRTRASAPGLVKVTGIVNKVNENEGTIVVDDLRFENSTKTLGTWTVTPPPGFNVSSVVAAEKLTFTVSPPTMLAASRTLTATEAVVGK